jgi:hypothetical protein
VKNAAQFTNAEYADMLQAVLTRFVKCIDAEGGIFFKFIALNKLCELCHFSSKYRY